MNEITCTTWFVGQNRQCGKPAVVCAPRPANWAGGPILAFACVSCEPYLRRDWTGLIRPIAPTDRASDVLIPRSPER